MTSVVLGCAGDVPTLDALFTTSQPVIFAYHGYPWLTNHHNIHVRGYKEEGTTTTPCRSSRSTQAPAP